MVDTGILPNNIRSPSPESYTTFWIMTIYIDTLHWSGISPIFDPITDPDLLANLTFYLFARGLHRTFATGAACRQRTLTPPDTWPCPTLGLAGDLMLREKEGDLTQSYDKTPYSNRNIKRPISPELVLSLDFWVSIIPQYFYLCSQR